jgi:hypothetical protein
MFEEARSARAVGEIGVAGQVLRFAWPDGLGWVSRLRLDPADRPGFLRIGALSVLDAAGKVLWSTVPTVADLRACAGIVAVPLAHDRLGLQLALTDDDPHCVLDLPPGLPGAPAMLEVEVDWPYAAEAVPLAQRLGESQKQVARHTEALARCAAQLAERTEALAAAEARHAAELASLRAAVAGREATLRDLYAERDALAERLTRAERLLDAVRNSKIWRLARRLGLTRIVL